MRRLSPCSPVIDLRSFAPFATVADEASMAVFEKISNRGEPREKPDQSAAKASILCPLPTTLCPLPSRSSQQPLAARTPGTGPVRWHAPPSLAPLPTSGARQCLP